MQDHLYRIIDANINRASEGLRVVEEIARFILEKDDLSRKIKDLRHKISQAANMFPMKPCDFIVFRDSEGDVGASLEVDDEKERDDYINVLFANMKRVQQSSRVLEEFGKIISQTAAEVFKDIRYQSYALEKEILSHFNHKSLDIELYVITGEAFAKGRPITQVVKDAVRGGAQAIQLREKNWSEKKLIQVGREIRKITREKNVTFIVNDRVDVAMAVDADGVHLGQNDMSYREARNIMGPGKIIGISTHSFEQAMHAQEIGADYIGVGPVFPTSTKTDLSPVVGLPLIQRLSKVIKIPFFAIGGINKSNAARVIQAGAPGIAVLSSVCGALQVDEAARELRDIIRKARRDLNDSAE